MNSTYEVQVRGAFREDGVWVINAASHFANGFPGFDADVVAEARRGILFRILPVAELGLERGATRAIVLLDEGDGVVTRLSIDEVIHRLSARPPLPH